MRETWDEDPTIRATRDPVKQESLDKFGTQNDATATSWWLSVKTCGLLAEAVPAAILKTLTARGVCSEDSLKFQLFQSYLLPETGC